MQRKRGKHFYIVIALFAVYFINGLIAIPRNSVTYDEMDHWSYGKRVLMKETDKIYPFDDASTMPVSGLNAIPRAFQQIMDPGLSKTDGGFSDIMNGRYVTLIVCLLTGFFIYNWSKQLFGEKGALLSLFLFVFCPNLNGHGALLTTDAYAALLTVSTAYFYWKFIKKSNGLNFLAFCTSLGLAQLVKYSMLHLIIFFGIVSIFVLIKRGTLIKRIGWNSIRLIVLGIVVLFFINLGFLFNKPGKGLDEFKMSSQAFTELQGSIVGSIPLPLPAPYIEGLDLTTYMNELGAGDSNVSDANYILGQQKTGRGFWYYYLIVFIFKTPLTVLLMLFSAVAFLLARKKRQRHPCTMLLLLGLIFYFLLVLGLQNNVQIGIRHALMAYPLLYVLCGFFATTAFFQKKAKIVQPLIVIYSLATYYYFFPNLISYSNELIPVKKNAYEVMADSNLDFGQGVYALEKYLRSHPDVYVADTTARGGKFAIRVSDYLNLKNDQKYSWMANLKPAGQINHCFLLFDNGY